MSRVCEKLYGNRVNEIRKLFEKFYRTRSIFHAWSIMIYILAKFVDYTILQLERDSK